MSDILQVIENALSKRFVGKEGLEAIKERQDEMRKGILTQDQMEKLERVLAHVDEIDPPK